MISEDIRVLVISNNVFSENKNNGKTLASFFEGLSSNNVYQLYFSNELPENIEFKNYFRISDQEVFKNFFSNRVEVGNKIEYREIKNEDESFANILIKKIKNHNTSRIIREFLWRKKRWNSERLNKWVLTINPDIIFFCAGDSEFAYDVTNHLMDITSAKLVTYITDDYILPRKYSYSLLSEYRRKNIVKKMKKTIDRSAIFITISEEMRSEYKRIFGKDSFLAFNMNSLAGTNDKRIINKERRVELVYAGGLHFRRYKTLSKLAKAISDYNRNTVGRKAFLSIYSMQKINEKTRKSLNIEGASMFKGGRPSVEINEILSKSDILVHVESFDKKSIESTKLSISTKIPEYMSLSKPILAIGPKGLASMNFLRDCAYCITNEDIISSEVIEFLQNENKYYSLGEKAFIKHKKVSSLSNNKILMSKIQSII